MKRGSSCFQSCAIGTGMAVDCIGSDWRHCRSFGYSQFSSPFSKGGPGQSLMAKKNVCEPSGDYIGKLYDISFVLIPTILFL